MYNEQEIERNRRVEKFGRSRDAHNVEATKTRLNGSNPASATNLEYMGRYTVKDADSAVTRIAHARPGSIPGRPTSLTLTE